MILLKELIAIDKSTNAAVYLQITNSFIHHIRQGRLRKGLKLPGSRELAALLGVNRMTAVAAYQELEAQGWIEMLPKKGTFVKAELPLLSPRKLAGETFHLPEQAGFSYDKKKIIPVVSSNYQSRDKLVINDGFPDVRLAPIEELTRC